MLCELSFSLEGDDVGVFELAEMLDVRLLDVPYFLNGHFLSVEFPQEDGSLGSAAHPLQVGDLLERNLPQFYGGRPAYSHIIAIQL